MPNALSVECLIQALSIDAKLKKICVQMYVFFVVTERQDGCRAAGDVLPAGDSGRGQTDSQPSVPQACLLDQGT